MDFNHLPNVNVKKKPLVAAASREGKLEGMLSDDCSHIRESMM